MAVVALSSSSLSSPIQQKQQQNLWNFPQHKVSVSDNILELDKKEIQQFFESLDLDKDGKLNRADLEVSLNNMKEVKLNVDAILEKCSENGSITLEAFSNFLTNQNQQLNNLINQLDTTKYEVEIKKEITITLKEKNLNAISQNSNPQPIFTMKREHLLLAREPKEVWDGFFQSTASLNFREAPTTSNTLNYLIAGGLAGAVSRTSTAPLDRLKLLLQVQRAGISKEFCGLLPGLTHIYHEGGITAFFRGNGTNIVKIVPESAVKFYTFEQTKRLLSQNDKTSLTLPLRFVAGATAGVTSQVFIYPLECVKTRLAISAPGTYTGIFNCITKMYQQEGISALFRGLRPALIGVVPYAGIDLTIYETLKSFAIKHNMKRSTSTPQNQQKGKSGVGVLTLLGCGIVSSSIGQLVSYPLALTRTRLQAQGLPGHPVIYSGMKDVFQKTLQNEGFKGLYKGLVPNFVKVAPAVSISYAVYESTKTFLG